jgi:hypothetical protein
MCTSCTQVEVLLTFCPPGPEERIKVSLRSLSATPRLAILSSRAFSFSEETVNRDIRIRFEVRGMRTEIKSILDLRVSILDPSQRL